MIRLVPTALLALCLVLASLTGIVAQTRMAAAGGYCGTQPAILLDARGLPLLDATGAVLMAPDCPACHLTLAVTPPRPQILAAPRLLAAPLRAIRRQHAVPSAFGLGGEARGPPVLA